MLKKQNTKKCQKNLGKFFMNYILPNFLQLNLVQKLSAEKNHCRQFFLLMHRQVSCLLRENTQIQVVAADLIDGVDKGGRSQIFDLGLSDHNIADLVVS